MPKNKTTDEDIELLDDEDEDEEDDEDDDSDDEPEDEDEEGDEEDALDDDEEEGDDEPEPVKPKRQAKAKPAKAKAAPRKKDDGDDKSSLIAEELKKLKGEASTTQLYQRVQRRTKVFDQKNPRPSNKFYAVLGAHPELFTRTGNSTWSLKGTAPKAKAKAKPAKAAPKKAKAKAAKKGKRGKK